MFHLENNTNIWKIGIVIVFFCLIVSILVSQGEPQVQVINNTICFLDGKTKIQIGKNDYYYIFSKQNRVVLISYQQESNSRDYTLNFFDFHGRKVAQPDVITGEMLFIFAEISKRVLAGQIAVLTKQNESYLYDLDGKLIKILTHDYRTKQIGITEDSSYFWFAAEKTRLLNPGEKPINPWSKLYVWNHIMLFDVSTGDFVEEYSTLDSNFSFLLNGKKYTIPVSPPDTAP